MFKGPKPNYIALKNNQGVRNEMKLKGSLIFVENIERSRAFYEIILQQKVQYDFGVNVSFEGGLAIHLKNHFEEIAGLKGSRNIVLGSNSFELYFETETIDKIYDELKNIHIEFLHGIEEQPWGQRVLRCYDPDKHLVEIGETMEIVTLRLYSQGLSLDEVVKKTGMPREFVEIVIKSNS
jgi:catechol 2,3-dioxygenase-like lactoylglutathione lyase family enzyme